MLRTLSLAFVVMAAWGPAARPQESALGTRGVLAGTTEVLEKDGAVEFRHAGELVTRYHVDPKVAKPYFWPLNAPGSVPVTRAWPMEKGHPNETTDHVHQKSAWFCHGDVIPEGIELKEKVKGVDGVDFWAEGKGHGRIVCTRISNLKATTDGAATVETHNEWRTADGVKILDEARTVRLLILDGGRRLLVLECDLHASVCPITFGDTKEGSLGVRVNDQFALNVKGSEGVVTAADGKASKAPARGTLPVWGQASDWHDYSGKVGGKSVGIAIFDDPKNPHRAYWHTRDYGLMAANPFGRARSGFPGQKGKTDLVKLAKGEHLKLRYGILVHAGDVQEGKVAAAYEQFVRRGAATGTK